MKSIGRLKNKVEDEQNYLVSVSDLMAGLLFIFIITLAVYALNFKSAERSQKEAETKHVQEKRQLENVVNILVNTRKIRTQMLYRIKSEALKFGINVSINEEHGILHLPEGILFDSGSPDLKDEGQKNLKILANIFLHVLPDFLCSKVTSEGPVKGLLKVGTIETIFIEGHTDRQPVRPGGKFKDNLELSTARARNTFKFLANYFSELINLKNCDGYYIFSLSGYGEYRPIRPYKKDEFDVAENRRIDFRFIMFPPEARPELIKEVEKRIENNKTFKK